jgi:hypothetical protein
MLMNVSEKIAQQIQLIPADTTFGYEQLPISRDEYLAAAKVLERMQKKGLIKKISKGVFYKPKMSVFGELKPNEQEILKPYLFQDGKRIAYITGAFLYNQLGLTTQLTRQIKIACRSKRIYVNTGAIKASPVKSYADVNDENYQLLGFLDAMKDLKIIPDADIKSAIAIFSYRIKQLTNREVGDMITYALLYPPRVRALLGAILEQLNRTSGIKELRKTLNPLTRFNLGIKPDDLKSVSNWNIQ